MSHLCYVYIPEYKGIKNIEIVVDPNYSCHFDKEKKKLDVKKTEVIPEGFWGRGIHSIAAIVGDNGVGKSTAVEYILHAVVEGVNYKDINGILVYEEGGQLSVYSKENIQLPEGIRKVSSPKDITYLYYSGHFNPGSSLNNLRLGELSGGYNISDGYLLVKDIQNYSNKDHVHNGASFSEHLGQYNAQNNIRICTMLADKNLFDRIKGYCQPKYLIISPNKSGAYAIKEYNRIRSMYQEQKEQVPEIIFKHNDGHNRVLSTHIYNNFLNILFNESHYDINTDILNCLTGWQTYLEASKPVLVQFKKFVKEKVDDKALAFKLERLCYALTEVDKLATFQSRIFGNGFYSLSVKEEYDKIATLCNILEQSNYLVAQYFDILYAQDLNTDTLLSSGEQKMLDLFSRLYYTIQKDCQKFCNLNAPALLILDEAEHAFHPDWQRHFIDLLISFLQQLLVAPGLKFQILITTHSPMLLSDIPCNCITFLKKVNNEIKNVTPKMSGTFAANVFDLYKNSFFLESGMIGEFATQKLKSIMKRIEEFDYSKEEYDEKANLMKEINLIGDVRVKEYILWKLSERGERDEILSFYKSRIRELEEGGKGE